jgi:hypothetical protein
MEAAMTTRPQWPRGCSAFLPGQPSRPHAPCVLSAYIGPELQPISKCHLLDDLIGAHQHRIRNCQAELARVEPWHCRFGSESRHARGATFSTSSAVVVPAATFIAPETRSGFMPSLKACSRNFMSSVSATIRRRKAGVISMIS